MKKLRFAIIIGLVLTMSILFAACGKGETGDKGDIGANGKSAYEIWLDNDHTGTEEDFLNWLQGTNGTNGTNGKSAYEIWLDNDHTGTEEDFLDWLLNRINYTISFVTNGAEQSIDPLSVLRGDKIPKPVTPIKRGHIFEGWYVDNNFEPEDKWIFFSYTVTDDITLYAKWTVSTYTLNFNGNDGNPTPKSKTVAYGQTMPLITVLPTRTNYNYGEIGKSLCTMICGLIRTDCFFKTTAFIYNHAN